MITRLKVENFQGFKGERSVDLAPITLIYGPNASGKSSIARAIKLFAQSFKASKNNGFAGFSFDGDLVSLRSYFDTVFGQITEDEGRAYHGEDLPNLAVEISFTPNSAIEELFQLKQVGLKILRELSADKNGDFYSDDYRTFIFENLSGDIWELTSRGFEPQFSPSLEETIQLALKFGADAEQIQAFREALLQPIRKPFDLGNGFLQKAFQDHLAHATIITADPADQFPSVEELQTKNEDLIESANKLMEDLVQEAKNWRHGFPVLPTDTMDSVLFENARDNSDLIAIDTANLLDVAIMTVSRGVSDFVSVEPIRQIPARVSIESSKFDLQGEKLHKVNEALGKLTGGRYQLVVDRATFEYAPTSVATLRMIQDTFTGALVSFDQVGTGISQVIPVLAAIYDLDSTGHPWMTKSQVVFVEQPELHLHPQMQSDLAGMIVDAQKTTGNQYIIETHSENILLRLQKMIRNGELKPEDVSLIFVYPREIQEDDKGARRFNMMRNIAFKEDGQLEEVLPLSFAGLRIKEFLE